MESKLSERKRTRLKYFDYSRNDAYFITICTQERKHILAKNMLVGDGVPYKCDNSTCYIDI